MKSTATAPKFKPGGLKGNEVIDIKDSENRIWLAYLQDIADLNTAYGSSLRVFDKDKLAVKGTSTGITIFSTANSSTTNYTLILPTENGTLVTTVGADFIGKLSASKLGLGDKTNPTAILHLPAGTNLPGTAPVKLTSGVPLDTPEDGTLEFHAGHLYFTIGGVRFQLDQQVINTTIVTLTGNTTLNASHNGATIECNGTFTVTFPNSMPQGMYVDLVNVGTGVITLAASTTLQSESSYNKLATQYTGASVYHRGSNVWLAVGKLTV